MPARRKAKSICEKFNKIVSNPVQQLQRLRSGKLVKVIGWLPTDVPEELIHATGAFPFGIVALNGRAVAYSDSHLQDWSCSLMRCSLGMALDGSLDLLNGLIIPHICDTTRMIIGIWKQTKPYVFMDSFLLPRQIDRPSAKGYLIGEMGRLKARLEQFMDRTVTAGELCASIRLYNQNRRTMRKLFFLHSRRPDLLGNRDIYNIIKASMMMPKDLHTDIISELLYLLEDNDFQNRAAKDKYKIRVILSGKVWEPPVLMDILDRSGVISVADDFCTGYRYIATDVPEIGEPLTALAERQFKHIPAAAFAGHSVGRFKYLVSMVKENLANGVIFVHLKGCEMENFDYPMLRDHLSSAGIVNFRLETEVNSLPVKLLEQRIKMLTEMSGGGL